MHYLLKNYEMNVKIHYFSMRLHVLGRSTQAQLPSFTFMALNSRRLWHDTKNSNWVLRDGKEYGVHTWSWLWLIFNTKNKKHYFIIIYEDYS